MATISAVIVGVVGVLSLAGWASQMLWPTAEASYESAAVERFVRQALETRNVDGTVSGGSRQFWTTVRVEFPRAEWSIAREVVDEVAEHARENDWRTIEMSFYRSARRVRGAWEFSDELGAATIADGTVDWQ